MLRRCTYDALFKTKRALRKRRTELLSENGWMYQTLITGYFLLLFFRNVMRRRRLGFNLWTLLPGIHLWLVWLVRPILLSSRWWTYWMPCLLSDKWKCEAFYVSSNTPHTPSSKPAYFLVEHGFTFTVWEQIFTFNFSLLRKGSGLSACPHQTNPSNSYLPPVTFLFTIR